MAQVSEIIIVCWVVFWLYWLISAFGSKKNTSLRLNRFMGVRVGLFVAAVVLVRVLNWQPNAPTNHLSSHSPALVIAGLILFFLGLFVAIWARIHLGRNWGMPMSEKQDPQLVTSGPYHYIRHPIYSGILLAGLGSALASNLYWILFLLIIGAYFIFSAVVEERLMARQFPKVYPAYKNRTKMLIPFIF